LVKHILRPTIAAEIRNDFEFRRNKGLEPARQRVLGRASSKGSPLCDDEQVSRVVKVAASPTAAADELATALHTARVAIIDCHARCGAEARKIRPVILARAAAAAVRLGQLAGGPPGRRP
jgi:hypothetical protein